jgi:hypothetical protein
MSLDQHGVKGDEMHLIIRKLNGKRLDALVLAVGENRLRAVVPGYKDVLELRRNYGLWSSDLGDLEVEAMTSLEGIDMNRVRAEFCPEERELFDSHL